MDTRTIIDALIIQHNIISAFILFGSSIIEYIFPPFPGDTITLAGAVLVGFYNWSFPVVFALVTSGSVCGAMLHYLVGRYIKNRKSKWLSSSKKSVKLEQQINILLEKFEKHGEVYIIINRFLPGIRGIFFIVAGMTKINPVKVAVYALISASLWNLIIMSGGYLLGTNFELLEAILIKYNKILMILIVLFIIFIVIWLWKKVRKGASQ